MNPNLLRDQFCLWPRKVMDISYLKEIERHVLSNNNHHPRLKNLVLSGPLEGSTLLLVACQDDNLEAVRYMVEKWHVDVRTPATHYDFRQLQYPHDELYPCKRTEGSTALLVVATCSGNSQLFRYVLDQGADAMARDSIGCTPIFLAATKLCLPLLNFLLRRDDVGRMEKIDAAEMAAAQLLLLGFRGKVGLAHEYLRQALFFRQMEVDLKDQIR